MIFLRVGGIFISVVECIIENEIELFLGLERPEIAADTANSSVFPCECAKIPEDRRVDLHDLVMARLQHLLDQAGGDSQAKTDFKNILGAQMRQPLEKNLEKRLLA